MKRTAFFISDGTGLTAEALGHALLAQFEKIDFERVTVPYIDDEDKAREMVIRINKAAEVDGERPLVFDTIVNSTIREIISDAEGFMIDIFGTFLSPLEQELSSSSSYSVGKSHSINNEGSYERRIHAVNFALDNDDGARTRHYDEADLILVGASRSGKTPTCLYLALQYGIKAANYPITEEDLDDQKMPAALRPHKEKLFGLTINADRLSDHRYMANLFRLFLHVQAHNLLVRIRREIAAPPLPESNDDDDDLPAEALSGRARKRFANLRRRVDPLGEGHPATWRTRLIKVAAEVVERARCIRVKLSGNWPYLDHFANISASASAFAARHLQLE